MRRPRFALVLLAMTIPIVAVLAASHRRSGPTEAAPDRPARTCASTRATAQTTVHTALKVHAHVSYPIAVTERVLHGANLISVTRQATIREDAILVRPIAATARAVVPARACATAGSLQAARGLARQRAYEAALAAAHRRSAAAAARRARQLAARLKPAQLGQATKLGTARARKAANNLKASLQRKALQQATAEATTGG